MASQTRHRPDYVLPILIFAAMAHLADLLMVFIADFHERYMTTSHKRPISRNHITSIIRSDLASILPLLAIYLLHITIFTRHRQRRVWATIGILAGLAIALLFPKPTFPYHQTDPLSLRKIVFVLLHAATLGDDTTWLIWLVHAGLGSAVLLSHTTFAKRLDPALPQDTNDVLYLTLHPQERKAKDKLKLWRLRYGSGTALLPAIFFSWVLAAELGLTATKPVYEPYFSRPPPQATKRSSPSFTSKRIVNLTLYTFASIHYILATETLAWNLFCTTLSGTSVLLSFLLMLQDDTRWPEHIFLLIEGLLVMHIANIYTFVSRRLAAPRARNIKTADSPASAEREKDEHLGESDGLNDHKHESAKAGELV